MPTEVLPLTGSLDIDTSLSIVKKGDFVDSLNTTAVSKLTNDSTIRTTEPGNQPFPVGDYVLPGGVSKVIGGISDETKNRIIDFLYNDSGACQIRWWDINTQTIKVILNDASDQTLDGTILDFDINAKITGISIIHRDPTDGDLLYWTTNDGNPPRCINIDKCLLNTGDYNGLSYDDISQIKRPPLVPPQVSYGNDTAHAANNLRSKLFQFAYRYIYDDYAPSTYSPWSKVPYPIGSVDPNIDTVMTNNNVINVSLGLINNLVVKIEIIVRVSVEPNLWSDPVLIDTIQISDPKPPSYGVAFYNDGAYPPVNVTEVAMLFSYLPDLASTMTMVNGNVIVMGEIVEGRNYNDVTLDVAMSAGLEDAFNSSSGQATPIPLTTSDFAVSVSYPDSVTATWTITYLGQTPIQGTAIVTLGYYVVTRQNHGLYSTKKAWETPPYPYVVFNMTEATPTASQNVKYQTSSTDHIITGDTNYNIVSVQGSRTNQSDLFFSQPRYDWWAHYQWALIYYDKNGKTNTAYTDTDMSLFMPPYHQYQNGVGRVDVDHRPLISMPPYPTLHRHGP